MVMSIENLIEKEILKIQKGKKSQPPQDSHHRQGQFLSAPQSKNHVTQVPDKITMLKSQILCGNAHIKGRGHIFLRVSLPRSGKDTILKNFAKKRIVTVASI